MVRLTHHTMNPLAGDYSRTTCGLSHVAAGRYTCGWTGVDCPDCLAVRERRQRVLGAGEFAQVLLYRDAARVLGWTVEQTHSISLASLRELVRPVDPALAEDISRVIAAGSHVARREG